LSATTETQKGRPSRKLIITIGVVAAIALITVASILTGGSTTNAPTNQLVGKSMRSFTLTGLNGGVEKAPWKSGLASVEIFFASWCGPCQSEMPKVATYLRNNNPSPVVVLGIDANDQKGAGRTFVKKDDVTFPVAFDPNGTVTSGVFGFGQLPETVFLNAKGVVVQVYIGAIPEKQLAQGIAKLKSS
jgi:thiol-disulfide isomerase/thioredoxin